MRHIWPKVLSIFTAGIVAASIAVFPAYAEDAHGAGVADSSQMAEPQELDLEGLTPVTADQLVDGEYEVQVDSSSSMFKIAGCVINVEKGEITASLTLGSTSYLYLFMGTAEEASASDSSKYISYEENDDGTSTFIIPVEALDQGIACAAFSRKKELWYDRTLVFRADSLDTAAFAEGFVTNVSDLKLEDGTYMIDVTLEGGSGRTSVESPAKLVIEGEEAKATVIFSSPNYDYMLVNGEKYEPLNEEGNSTFEIPVTGFDYRMPVTADTTAMSKPYEIDYTLYFDSSTIRSEGNEAGMNEEELDDTGSSLNPSEEMTQTDTALQPDLSAGETENHGNYYATQFQVEGEAGGIRRITIGGTDRYLLVPEGAEAPSDIEEGVTVLRQPFRSIYLAASSGMDFFRALGHLDEIRFTSTKEKDWSMDEVADRIKTGQLIYAGKYNAPDYELLLSEGTDLAIESMMISHSPETKEQLERLGIPVLVERSSYESDPLGRMEWIRFYGLLAGCEEEADAWYEEELRNIENLQAEQTSKVVAFFHISSNGYAVVRRPDDYVTKMIIMAGGQYFLDENDVSEDTSLSTTNMEMESFYEAVRDADLIIYNSTIDGTVETIDDLLQKNSMLADFRAVQEGNVWCTERNLYQQITCTARMIQEMNRILSGETDDGKLTFFHKVRL